jgi:predicted RNA-binding protein with TRAM domain
LNSSNQLLCLFSSRVSASGDDHVVDVPRREIESGSLEPGERYRVALVRTESEATNSPGSRPQPPVEPGEMRYVEIVDLGKQGDGIARVERGYVIIIPETTVDDRVKIEVTDVEPNFAVGEVVEST